MALFKKLSNQENGNDVRVILDMIKMMDLRFISNYISVQSSANM